MMPECRGRWCALITALFLVAPPLYAVVQPQDSPVRAKEFRHEALRVIDDYSKASEVSGDDSQAVRNIAALGVSPAASYLDRRSGRWGTLMPSEPLLPDNGLGLAANADERQVWEAFVGYLQSRQDALLIDIGELANPGNIGIRENGTLIQIHAPRVVDGVPVRDSFLTAVLRFGHLSLFGSRNWGDVRISAQPTLSDADAQAVVLDHLQPLLNRGWRKSSLIFLPMAAASSTIGEGVGFRLAWSLQPIFDGDVGRWEALVDAHSGELLAFEDKAQYASAREVEGSVYPRSNDGIGPEGTEQPDFPMPFADVENAGDNLFTDSGGNLLACVDGDITTTLSGLFVQMSDNCGAISEATSADVLDLGFDFGTTDCAVPANAPSGSAGNTHASRTGFYELNRIKEMGRSHLPTNTWLQQQLNANMNITMTCNATWDGANVNFFRSGNGCGNTGELAGVFDHEWGHGMDNNDLNPTISNPGEGIADIYAYGRLVDSCIGPGFLLSGNCGGYGDPCKDCSGVRDIDWNQRSTMMPHDVAWADANCGAGGGTPCGGSTHCEGAVYAEAFFDLINRDLPANFGMDLNTALEVANRLNFIGAGLVGNWFQCIIGFGGCNADGGYLNYLVADDDDMNLANGTPHMSAIFAAFDRHGIACGTPTVTDSGCAGTPVIAPTVSGVPQDRSVTLSWNDVGADHYKIYRTDGVLACDFGKAIVGQTTGTTFTDTGLKNGHDYSYVVIPFGPHDTCFGPSSSCVAVTTSPGPNLAIPAVADLELLVSGDGDVFLDNCEQGKFTVPVFNVGTGSLSNVEIVDVVPLSHPTMTVFTPLPLRVDTNLQPCEEAAPMIKFQAADLSPGEVVEFRVDVTSDQLGAQSQIVRITDLTEGDFAFQATRTFSFETDREGWQVVSGTFDQVAGGGGNGSSGFLASSSNTPNNCDNVRSPILSLTSTSEMTVWTNFNIEPFCGACAPPQWYDRANIGIFDLDDASRSVVSPSTGRTYNASGNSATSFCTNDQPGWADNQLTWATSEFTSADLDATNIAGRLVQLDVAYGTDPAFNMEGLRFDEVTVTDFNLQEDDAQSDVCLLLGPIFLDGFESGDISAW